MVRRIRRILLLIVLVVALAAPSWAAIAFDASAEGSASASTLTYSHTVGAGSNRILWVGGYVTDGATWSGVTYNGVAMTSAGTAVTDAGDRTFYLFYLVAPASGTHDVVVSVTPGSPNIRAVSASYTDANQTGVPDAYTTKTDTNSLNPYTHSITTVANNSWIVMIAFADQIMTGTNSATMREEHADQSLGLFDTNGAITPAGSTTMGISYTFASTVHTIVLGSFAPTSGGGGSGSAGKLMLGLGR